MLFRFIILDITYLLYHTIDRTNDSVSAEERQRQDYEEKEEDKDQDIERERSARKLRDEGLIPIAPQRQPGQTIGDSSSLKT